MRPPAHPATQFCWLALVLLLAAGACGPGAEPGGEHSDGSPGAGTEEATGDERAERANAAEGGSAARELDRDVHSFARPQEVAVRHLALDLTVDFAARRLRGRASLDVENRSGADRLFLDTRDLEIRGVTANGGRELAFTLGDPVPDRPHLGRELAIELPRGIERVHVDYATSPEAAAVQWLAPAQTAEGKHPFLFTQSQAILARTWVPCQDTPAVRMTYEARVTVPPELMAVMSAENPTARDPGGIYEFRMPQPIPSYLLALAVGDLTFRPLGSRSGVYAEPSVVEAAAAEFAEVPEMMAAAERLYGPYRWGRYDILVLPPSFPFGGMENPRLTFATPTIIAGDRSLVSLIAHELAHSWSGNLVTNATWNDFWLNEGTTTYLERRIMEELHGADHAAMLWALGLQDLRKTIAELGPESADTHLHLDLEGRNPDDGVTSIAYEKGALFFRQVEEAAGRDRFDAFLKRYFDAFAFQSLTTKDAMAFLRRHLLDQVPGEAVPLDAWVYGPGLPEDHPRFDPAAFRRVEEQITAWRQGTAPAELATAGWTTFEWLHLLRHLPGDLTPAAMAELDAAFHFTESGNAEILAEWLGAAIRHGYDAADPALERFLMRVGRRKFLQPLYAELVKTPAGKERARRIYAKARPGYHAVTTRTLDELLR